MVVKSVNRLSIRKCRDAPDHSPMHLSLHTARPQIGVWAAEPPVRVASVIWRIIEPRNGFYISIV